MSACQRSNTSYLEDVVCFGSVFLKAVISQVASIREANKWRFNDVESSFYFVSRRRRNAGLLLFCHVSVVSYIKDGRPSQSAIL